LYLDSVRGLAPAKAPCVSCVRKRGIVDVRAGTGSTAGARSLRGRWRARGEPAERCAGCRAPALGPGAALPRFHCWFLPATFWPPSALRSAVVSNPPQSAFHPQYRLHRRSSAIAGAGMAKAVSSIASCQLAGNLLPDRSNPSVLRGNANRAVSSAVRRPDTDHHHAMAERLRQPVGRRRRTARVVQQSSVKGADLERVGLLERDRYFRVAHGGVPCLGGSRAAPQPQEAVGKRSSAVLHGSFVAATYREYASRLRIRAPCI